LKKLSYRDVCYHENGLLDISVIKKLIKNILKLTFLKTNQKRKLQNYLNNHSFINPHEFSSLLYKLPSPILKNSLFTRNPKKAKEWHPTKNGFLSPKDVVPGSTLKVWWQCSHGHEWENIIRRHISAGCPDCNKRRANQEYNLHKMYPLFWIFQHPHRLW